MDVFYSAHADVHAGPMGRLGRHQQALGMFEAFRKFAQLVANFFFFLQVCRVEIGSHIGDEVDDILVAVFGLILQSFAENFLEPFGHEANVKLTVAEFSQYEFVTDNTQRIDVRRIGDRFGIFSLLWTHVYRCANQTPFAHCPLESISS